MAAINELDAFCVALPHNVSPFAGPDNEMFMPVVFDEYVGHHTLDSHVPTEPAWAVISQICLRRAVLCVDRGLVVNGRPISPEGYIKRWRDRLARPVPLSRLALDKGLRAVAVFQWRHSPAIAERTANWVNPPFARFGDLLAEHGCISEASTVSHPGFGVRTLQVDLSARDGAQIAWWADDFLSSSAISDQVISRRVDLHQVPFDAQPASFHSAAPLPSHEAEPATF